MGRDRHPVRHPERGQHPEIPFWSRFWRVINLFGEHINWAIAPFVITFGATIPLLINPAFAETTLGQNLPLFASVMLSLALVSLFALVVVEHFIVPPRPRRMGSLGSGSSATSSGSACRSSASSSARCRRSTPRPGCSPGATSSTASPRRPEPRVPPIARVRLARSLPRLLALPFSSSCWPAPAIAAGVLGVTPSPAASRIDRGRRAARRHSAWRSLVTLLSVRLDVEEAAVRVSWLGGEPVYVLSPGPVTRVRLRGANASQLASAKRRVRLEPRPGRLRGEEQIEIVRLAPTATAILVPTERGRLAIAPAREEDLLDALSRAARARQQLEALAPEAGEPVETGAEAIAPPVADAPPAVAAVEVPQRPLTGIERALLEEQLAQERAAAELAGGGEMPDVAAAAVTVR